MAFRNKQPKVSLVSAKLDFAAPLPVKDDALGIDDSQRAGYEPWVLKFAFSDLAFARKSFEIGAPGDRASWHVIITGNFDRLDFSAILNNSNDLIEMARVITDPFSR